MSYERVHVVLKRQLVHVGVAASPELAFERHGLRLNGPRAIAQRLIAPEPVENDAQVPVGHRVAEEEEVAAPKLRCDRYRDDARDVRLSEVVDVVVLGDDEALPLPFAAAVDLSVQLE